MTMNIKTRTETIPASGIVDLGPGNFIFLVTTSAALNVQFQTGGFQSAAEGVQGGFVQGNVTPWRNCRIVGTAGITFVALYGDADLTEDVTDYRRTVGVFLPQQPGSNTDYADVNVGGSGVAILVLPANAARRKGVVKFNTGGDINIRLGTQATVAAGRGAQLESGQSYDHTSTGALYAIREGAGTAVVSLLDENY